MQIIDAYWEKKNLDVDTLEIICDSNDSEKDLVETLESVHQPYIVLKIAYDNNQLMLKAQEMGFQLIENSISLSAETKDLVYTPLQERFINNTLFKEADEEDKENVLRNVKNGTIYQTDRIAVDPFFSKKIAGNRYYNWMRQLIEDDAKLSVIYYKDNVVAFAINKRIDDKTYEAVLGGCMPDYKNKGLGFLSVYATTHSIKLQGGTKIVTHVSSNNLPVLKLHLENGFKITNMEYVLIKHQ